VSTADGNFAVYYVYTLEASGKSIMNIYYFVRQLFILSSGKLFLL